MIHTKGSLKIKKDDTDNIFMISHPQLNSTSLMENGLHEYLLTFMIGALCNMKLPFLSVAFECTQSLICGYPQLPVLS